VDGYRFGPDYLSRLAAAGSKVLLLDDYAPWAAYPVQLVLNQNVLAARSLYPSGSGAGGPRYLLGPEYALLRGEIAAGRESPPMTHDRARRILVTLGGADPPNTSRRILDALRQLPQTDLEIRVILGPSNPHRASLAEAEGDRRVAIIPAVREMVPHLTWADVAITAAGSTVYELACLGIPTLVVAIADYQRNLAAALERAGLARSLGWHADLQPAALALTVAGLLESPTLRGDLSRRGREIVDGRGVGRVLAAMRSA
jgi:spore coat polysaccharide biosynthesis predicted glycosyltransferase SpsG